MATTALQPSKQEGRRVSIWVLILSNLLVFQLSGFYRFEKSKSFLNDDEIEKIQEGKPISATDGTEILNPLAIPRGTAVALPSIRVDSSEEVERGIYGGEGDKGHLGGFTKDKIDMDGVSVGLWKYMVADIGIKSILDVGCGRGISTSWFHLHDVETLCVEGSHDAVESSVLSPEITTEHDFSRGPWWPPRTVDAIWCVELLEHVGRNFHKNLIPTFRKAALIYATHSTWGGWHHVEVHTTEWWIWKFESYGFKYSESLTLEARGKAQIYKDDMAPNEMPYRAQHLRLHLMVFVNPMVASLPEHHHLITEPGCFKKRERGTFISRECGTATSKGPESKLPDSFKPLQMDASMDAAWEKLVFGKSGKDNDSIDSSTFDLDTMS